MTTPRTRTTAVALASGALLAAGALAGCSSDTTDDSATVTTTTQPSPTITEADMTEFCAAANSPMSVTADDGTVKSQSSENIEAWAEADSLSDADVSLAFSAYYEGMRASAPPSLDDHLDVAITYYKEGGDWRNVTTEVFDATSAIGQTVVELCPTGDATD